MMWSEPDFFFAEEIAFRNSCFLKKDPFWIDLLILDRD